MLLILWEYIARTDRVEEFEALYHPEGPWTEMFRGAPGYVSTTLWKDLRNPRHYLVADRWASVTLYEEFKHAHATAYTELNQRGKRLIERETELGRFGTVV
jgi:heme-degrading monooxygenase HmoA